MGFFGALPLLIIMITEDRRHTHVRSVRNVKRHTKLKLFIALLVGVLVGGTARYAKGEEAEPSYDALIAAAKKRVAAAYGTGKTAEVRDAVEALKAISSARFLDSQSRLSEAVTPLFEGFKPQLATLPDLAKAALGKLAASGPKVEDGGFYPGLVQAIDIWLRASNIAAAKQAAGDVVGAMDIQGKIEVAGKAAAAEAAKKPVGEGSWSAQQKAEKDARKAAAETFVGIPK